MTMTPVGLPDGAVVLEGPERVGSELRWRVRLADGRPALLAALADELARDPALRRRYVRDLTRLRELEVPGLTPLLALGPAPDPTDPEAAPPWRLRADPPGETLEAWLARRAPLAIDDAVDLAIALAELLGPLHAHGVVLRDLHPRLVMRAGTELWLTDVGLGRIDILSTRTAASLLLEGSPYAAPEQFARTALDPRADLYALGVILYRALTGLLPRGEGPAFMAESPVAPPQRLRAEVSPALSELVLACLALTPDERPASARELAAILRGEALPGADTRARVACQHCGAALRLGQRLCLACGRVAVQFASEQGGEHSVVLQKAREDTRFIADLDAALSPLHDGPLPALNFVIGDARMYSKAEKARRRPLPLQLFGGLSKPTAQRLQDRLKAAGFAVKVKDEARSPARRSTALVWTAAAFTVPLGAVLVMGAPLYVVAVLLTTALAVMIIIGLVQHQVRKRVAPIPFLQLRSAPALPASDPLVARLAALLTPDTAPEVRERVGGLALAVQRLVDHRAAAPGARAEVDALTQPVTPLIALIEAQVLRLRAIDTALVSLDEGNLVRALAASEARGEPAQRRADLLAGLDRLRALEDERAAIFHRLLEAESLLRRSVELGLGVHDEETEQARRVEQALHALTAGRG